MSPSDSSNTNTTPHPNTVILGAGIIGLCTAYYLSESGNTDPKSILLVDSSPKLFHCASGFAAGFLSADWFAPSVSSLGALSFKLHADLASAHAGRTTWGYARSTGISLSQDSESESAVSGSGEDWLESGTSRAQLANHNRPWEEGPAGPQWLRRTKEGIMEVISKDGTAAQIDPSRFCQWLLQRCKERGVQVLQPARAISVSKDANGTLNGVRISKDGVETEIQCNRLVITSGAWSPRVFATLFPSVNTRIPVSSLAGHSLLVRNPHFNPAELDKEVCHAIFATDTLGFSPEWFARIGGELYLAGLNSTNIPLPDVATDVKYNEKAIEQLKSCAKAMMLDVEGKEFEVLRESLCFRPITSSGRPLVSRIPDEKLGKIKTRGGGEGGVFIAAGHGAWGISHAPGTGLVLAELIEGRQTSAKIEALRLPA
ncbi:FAD dependent oxidoreductase-like protein superfamily [Cucurbitaria berberidis CBS 394.84]|uniref:FAD dependent oxidoreductase-like protein superfamily n=1 Tax=Cucurbitaria berberidis CBS 394.84 TaxID=1168544 RepID=A0A9P4L5C1_9PLEO|nr:FAD dependent oxidoreductase-like protein superfamily [Cucurbitaria berberidis CBS 394.84]KAF1842465.1 FAD dependent oxidoreductase-like protein superfamily [Cucurbitaria berberidis CBS 394.84]